MKVSKILSFALAFPGLIIGSVHAQPVSPIDFFETSISTAENGATDVFAIDVDGDGDVDILSSSYLDDTVAWYENDGNGNFTQHNISTSVNTASSVYAIDMDDDDDIDVVSVAYSDDAVYWFENNGSQSFTKHTLSTTIDGPRHAMPADLDDDDDMDIIVASSNDGKITFYENDGSQNFTENTVASSISGVTNVFVIDLDNDNIEDIVYAADVADEIGWLENDGSENFTKNVIASSLDGANSVYAIDINYDGFVDVLTSISVDDEIAWFENDGSESFTKHSLTTSADGASDVFAGDLDYDGDIDVLAASNGDDTISWFENNGSESFTEHNLTTSANGARSVFAADIGDGFGLDVLSASFFDDSILLLQNVQNQSKFTGIRRNDINNQTGILPHLLNITDIDRDGDNDIIVGSSISKKINWLLNDGKGKFTSTPGDTLNASIKQINTMITFDLDQNGFEDIIYSDWGLDQVVWFENSGNLNFTKTIVATNIDNARDLVTVDFDQDGDIDIIVAAEETNEAVLLQNNGSQTFSEVTLLSEAFKQIEFMDFDKDGDRDIIIINKSSLDLKIYLNDGSNNFSSNSIYSGVVRDFSINDMDKDGDYDLILVEGNKGVLNVQEVFWLENTGGLSFTKQSISTSLNLPFLVEVTDFDIDGDLDVVMVSLSDKRVSLFENDGSQNFNYHFINYRNENHSLLSSDTSLRIADINSDGLLDIVLSLIDLTTGKLISFLNPLHKPTFPNFSETSISSTSTSAIATVDIDLDGDQDIVSTGVSLILNTNNGSGTFSQSTLASGLSITRDLFPIDLDSDGDIDVVTAEFSGDEISWYENDGEGSFSDNDITTSVDGPIALEVADLDQDGDWDVIAGIDNDAEFVWYENDGSESFSKHVISSSYSDPSDLKVIDVDMDGDLDIVGSAKLDNTIFWLENNGSEVFTAHTIDPSLTLASTLDVGDIDQDGDIDVVAVGSSDINIYLNSGSQSFSKTNVSSISIIGEVMLKDVDLDGDMDIIYLNAGAETIGWLENDGGEDFTAHTVGLGLSQLVRGIGIADLTGDGKLDFISGAEGLSSDISWFQNSTYTNQITLGGAAGAQWRLFSLPKSGATLGDINEILEIQGIADGDNPSSDDNIFTYDNTGAWETPSSVNDALTDGYGFALYTFDDISDSLDIRGSEPTADVTVALNKSTLESGVYYTLVGNPYYSNYDLNSLTVNTGNLQDNVSFWDAKAASYQVKDIASNYIISPFQGFWVGVANGNSATTLTFPKTGKTDSDTSGTWLRKQSKFRGDLQFSLRSETGHRDEAIRLSVRDYAELGWDRADAGKIKPLINSYMSLSFQSEYGEDFMLKSVESLPVNLSEEVLIPLDLVTVGVQGNATLSWDNMETIPSNWGVVLTDFETLESVNLRIRTSYSFQINSSLDSKNSTSLNIEPSGQPRFSLRITPGATVNNEEGTKPLEYSLSQNYPNPFNPSTTITYSIVHPGNVNISVYNLLGQKVATLINENKTTGTYQIRFNAASLSSGVYFYRLETGSFVSQHKMTLIK